MRPQQVMLRFVSLRWIPGLMLFSALSWAQIQQSLDPIPSLPIQRAVLHGPDLESRTDLLPFSAKLQLAFKTKIDQNQPLVRFFTTPAPNPQLLFHKKNNLYPRAPIGTDVLQSSGNGSRDGAPNRWLTFTPSYGELGYRPNDRDRDLKYYSQHIPFAGPLVLQFAKQADAHPRVTRVLKIINPQF